MLIKIFKSKQGFTLVELMVVVGIIGIVTAIAIPLYSNVLNNTEQTTCAANRHTIESAYAIYISNSNTATNDINALLPTYIAQMPVCPSEGKYTLNNGVCSCDKVGH